MEPELRRQREAHLGCRHGRPQLLRRLTQSEVKPHMKLISMIVIINTFEINIPIRITIIDVEIDCVSIWIIFSRSDDYWVNIELELMGGK